MYRSLANFEGYQRRYYEQLQAFPPFREIAPVIERFISEAADEGEFCLRMRVDALEQVVATGYVKSMVETGTGATNGGPEVRRRVVSTLFGCTSDKMDAADFPKFGYLGPRDARADYISSNGMDYQYGSVVLRLNRKHLFERTTLCFGNSVGMGACNVMMPTLLSNVKATCLPGLPHSGHAMMPMPNPWAYYLYFFTQIAEGKLTRKNFHRIEMLTECLPTPIEYFELQYHGPVALRGDVGEVVALVEPDERERVEALRPALAAAGVTLTVLTSLFPDDD